jgi:hypothetical protein
MQYSDLKEHLNAVVWAWVLKKQMGIDQKREWVVFPKAKQRTFLKGRIPTRSCKKGKINQLISTPRLH